MQRLMQPSSDYPAPPTGQRSRLVRRAGRRALRMSRDAGQRLLRTGLRLRYRLPEVELAEVAKVSPSAPVLVHDDICLPPYYGPAKHDDVTPLLRIVQSLRPRCVLELGTAHGNTTANICANSVARVVTVNALPEQISGAATTFTLRPDEIGRVYRSHGYAERVVQVYANTLSFDHREWMEDGAADLAIVDACHDTPYVVNDFLKAVPAVREGGVILLHDTHPSLESHLIGSTIACARLRRNGYDIRHIRGTWWGYWTKPVSATNAFADRAAGLAR